MQTYDTKSIELFRLDYYLLLFFYFIFYPISFLNLNLYIFIYKLTW